LFVSKALFTSPNEVSIIDNALFTSPNEVSIIDNELFTSPNEVSIIDKESSSPEVSLIDKSPSLILGCLLMFRLDTSKYNASTLLDKSYTELLRSISIVIVILVIKSFISTKELIYVIS